MATLTPEQLRVLWYLLAGFVLGFIFSTLWEWLYFRGIRLRRSQTKQQAEFRTRAWSAPNSEEYGAGQPSRVAHNERATAHYQSQGVLLENEQSTDQLFVSELSLATPVQPIATTPLVVESAQPRRAVIVPIAVPVLPAQPQPTLQTNPLSNDESTLNSIQEGT